MKTAIITGVTGQDGRFLSELLLKKGYIVVGLVSPDRIRLDDEWVSTFSKVEMRAVDFNDSMALSRVIAEVQPDEFYNLVAASSVKYSFDYPFETAQITAMAPIRILEVLRHIRSTKHIKFYQASSSEMFGNGPSSGRLKHLNSSLLPHMPYQNFSLINHARCTKMYMEYSLRVEFSSIMKVPTEARNLFPERFPEKWRESQPERKTKWF